MRKYLPVLLLIVLIIPSITFASWWNPFSWNIFSKTNNNTQILEKRIKELENKLNDRTVATTTPTTKENVSENKTTPTIDSSSIIKKQVQIQVEATLKAKAEQDAFIAKQRAEEKAKEEKAYLEKQVTQTPVQVVETTPIIYKAVLFEDLATFRSNVPLDPRSLSIITPKDWTVNGDTKSQTCYMSPHFMHPLCPDWLKVDSVRITKDIITAQRQGDDYLYTVKLTNIISTNVSKIYEPDSNNNRVYKISISIPAGKALISRELLVTASSTISLNF